MLPDETKEAPVPQSEVRVKPGVKSGMMNVMAVAAMLSAGGTPMKIERSARQVKIRAMTKGEIAEREKKKNKRKMAAKSRKMNRR